MMQCFAFLVGFLSGFAIYAREGCSTLVILLDRNFVK